MRNCFPKSFEILEINKHTIVSNKKISSMHLFVKAKVTDEAKSNRFYIRVKLKKRYKA